MGRQADRAPLAAGFYPFWFWNGNVTAEEVEWQIAQMAAQGIRGFFIHPRQGLRLPYLSEDFLHLVGVAVAAAKTHGLSVHLYDEYPYPSGVVGGELVLGNPAHMATRLIQASYDIEGPDAVRVELPRGKILACQAYPLRDGEVAWSEGRDLRPHVGMVLTRDSFMARGLSPYNQKRYFASDPVPVLSVAGLTDPHRVFVSVQALVEAHKYWGHFVDVLNPEAMAAFVELTHERYKARFNDEFGQTVLSIYSDETSPGWSATLPAAFAEAYGYDLLESLPALQDASHPDHVRVARDLYALRYRRFCRNFDARLRDWCEANRLRYTGEKPSLRLSQLRYMDIPGCDQAHTRAGKTNPLVSAKIRANARATASAAYFYGKEGALCEAFHSLGWGATLQDVRLLCDGLLLHGIRYLVPHAFFYTTHGLAKHDAPPSLFFQMPYWPLFGALSERVSRIDELFQGTHVDAQVLVVDPQSGIPTDEHQVIYERLLRLLMEAHVDFLIVDTDILESGTMRDGCLRIRDLAARIVLVPPMQAVEQDLDKQLRLIEHLGGCVVRLNEDSTPEAAVEVLQDKVEPSLRFCVRQGESHRLHMVSRTDGEQRLWFLVNTSERSCEVEFAVPDDLIEVPLTSGASPQLRRANDTLERRLEPFEAVMLQQGARPKGAPLPQVNLQIPTRMVIRPLSQNLLRLGAWQLRLQAEDGEGSQAATVSPQPLANQLQAGGFAFPPAWRFRFGQMPEMQIPVLRLEYRASFENAFGGPVALLMEPGSIEGDWRVRFNEGAWLRGTDFRPANTMVRHTLMADATDALVSGRNEITVEVQTDRADGGLLNPLYLAGDFGVALDPLGLIAPRREGRFDAWEENGLPYYAGVVEYQGRCTLDALPETPEVEVRLAFAEPFEDACEVSLNGHVWRGLPWSPYRVVVPRDELHAQENDLGIRVYSSLLRAFEGQRWDIRDHACQSLLGA